MTTANMPDPNTMIGAPVSSTGGESLGKINSIYLDNETNQPAWAAVKTGIFGGHVSLVPLGQCMWDGNALTVPFDKGALNDAPHHDPDTSISRADEERLYRHYGLLGEQRDLDQVLDDDAEHHIVRNLADARELAFAHIGDTVGREHLDQSRR